MTTPTISKLHGTGYKQISMPTLSPEQQKLFSQVSGALSPGLTSGVGQLSQLTAGGSPEMWQQLEAPALRQFGELQGNLASRFSGMGTGARRSSGFQNTMNSATGDLAERLQSQRLGLQHSAIQELLGLYGNLMGTQTFNTGLLAKKKPFWQELLGGMAPSIGQGLGQGLGFLPFL